MRKVLQSAALIAMMIQSSPASPQMAPAGPGTNVIHAIYNDIEPQMRNSEQLQGELWASGGWALVPVGPKETEKIDRIILIHRVGATWKIVTQGKAGWYPDAHVLRSYGVPNRFIKKLLAPAVGDERQVEWPQPRPSPSVKSPD